MRSERSCSSRLSASLASRKLSPLFWDRSSICCWTGVRVEVWMDVGGALLRFCLSPFIILSCQCDPPRPGIDGIHLFNDSMM